MRTCSNSYAGKEVLRENYARYYQLIHGIEIAVGKLRASVEQHGLAENTVIVFSSGHGLLMGE